ncbi:UbiA family prenyltransferase [Pseudomonas sp. HMWF006]|uniref:UbiA family prenyltransferase n=1 Tax=Pseudomonas sp. HMWF006 TaxID=2056843 RepID=UPI000D478511|nr:UbiA family prenyltransferase [Pseudomonas sp. HMWF006]PTT02746.1 UbiA family prenyltransferase [Pseudomonas sp. HMWF006]PTT59679.1 UbiA family prenyltransferase [Pseudomonas sp. HMWF007]PTT91330.1 UbiA family prenyltransferase [Pseudomonas sp. HMWF005]
MPDFTPTTASCAASTPFVVDLDGTLLKSDLLFECVVSFIRTKPLQCLKPLAWLWHGKAYLKERLAQATDIDVTSLPYDPDVLWMIEAQRNGGRKIVLATASHYTLAVRIAGHLKVFDEVLGTTLERNLSGAHKRNALVTLYGERGFDYVGNSLDDLPVWRSARQAFVVNPLPGVERATRHLGNAVQVVRPDTTNFKSVYKALRIHQWVKNALIFIPLLAAHQLVNPLLLWHGVLAFVFFGLCASGVYVLNDLLDLADDRKHPTKRHRPFASGALSIKSGLLTFPLLLLVAFTGAWLCLPHQFVAVLACYYVLTLVYSLWLKRLMALDVIALALLYTLRIIAGGAAFELELTGWMLAFAMFMFLSLALVKRYAELLLALHSGITGKTGGRDYFPADLAMLSSLGAASGYLAVIVLALYIQDSVTTALYAHPRWIWLACPVLLLWITRIWLLTHRGRMNDDPVVFALRDHLSLAMGAVFCLIFWVAV